MPFHLFAIAFVFGIFAIGSGLYVIANMDFGNSVSDNSMKVIDTHSSDTIVYVIYTNSNEPNIRYLYDNDDVKTCIDDNGLLHDQYYKSDSEFGKNDVLG